MDPEGTEKPVRGVCFTTGTYDVERRWQWRRTQPDDRR